MLALTLQAFGVRGVNLMALQSRPERAAPWTYRFYVDVDGSADDPRVAEALEEVGALAARVVVLGSYEAWVEGSRLSAPPPTPAHHTRKPDIPLVDRRRQPEGSRVEVRHVVFGGEEPVLIAGPCSVESEAMLLETAEAVGRAGADMLRGGAYKPRTSPYDFQGLGVKGLRYMAEARERTGLPIVTEVLSWEEVAVVAHFADMLQIGARNMQNFTLLRAAARSGKPVLLKRGAGALIEEWLMAAEYVLAEGNPNVVLCERGIRTFERATRHTLDLNAVVMVRERTHLPVIVDPSHAAGVRSLVAPLSLGCARRGGLRAHRRGAPRSQPRHERRRPESRPADVRGAGASRCIRSGRCGRRWTWRDGDPSLPERARFDRFRQNERGGRDVLPGRPSRATHRPVLLPICYGTVVPLRPTKNR